MKIINNLPKLTNMGDIENSIQNLESSKAPVGEEHCYPVTAHVSTKTAGLSFYKGNDGGLYCVFGEANYQYVASFSYIVG